MDESQPHVSFFGENRGRLAPVPLTQLEFESIPSVRDGTLERQQKLDLFNEFAQATGKWFTNPDSRGAALRELAHGVDLDELADIIDEKNAQEPLDWNEQYIFNYYERRRLQSKRPRYRFAQMVAGKRKQEPEVFLDTAWLEQMISDVTAEAHSKYIAIVEAEKRVKGITMLTSAVKTNLVSYQTSINQTLENNLPDLLALSGISFDKLDSVSNSTNWLKSLGLTRDENAVAGPSLFHKNSVIFPEDSNEDSLRHTTDSDVYAVYADTVLIDAAVSRNYIPVRLDDNADAKRRIVVERAQLGVMSATAAIRKMIMGLTVPSPAQKLAIKQTMEQQLTQIETDPTIVNHKAEETQSDQRSRLSIFQAIQTQNYEETPYLQSDKFYKQAKDSLEPLISLAAEALAAFGNVDPTASGTSVALDPRWITFCRNFMDLTSSSEYDLELALEDEPGFVSRRWFLNRSANQGGSEQRIFLSLIPVSPYVPYAVSDSTSKTIAFVSPTSVASYATERVNPILSYNAEPWARPRNKNDWLDVAGLNRTVVIHSQLIETLFNPVRTDTMNLRTSDNFKTSLLFLLEQRVSRRSSYPTKKTTHADDISIRLIGEFVRENSGSGKLLALYNKAKDLLRFISRSSNLRSLPQHRPGGWQQTALPEEFEATFTRTDGTIVDEIPDPDFVFELFTDGNPDTGFDLFRVVDKVLALTVLINAEEVIAQTAATQFVDLRLGILLVAIRYHVVRTMLHQVSNWLLVDLISVVALLDSDKREVSKYLRDLQETAITRDDSDPREKAVELAIRASPFALQLDEFNGKMLSAINSAELLIRQFIPNFNALDEIDKGDGADSELLSVLQDATAYQNANDIGMTGANPETNRQTARLDQEITNIRYRLAMIKHRLGV